MTPPGRFRTPGRGLRSAGTPRLDDLRAAAAAAVGSRDRDALAIAAPIAPPARTVYDVPTRPMPGHAWPERRRWP